jgi:hypothetical protein
VGCLKEALLRNAQSFLTRMLKFDRDKRSSLLRKFVNYGRKKFYNIGPRKTQAKPKTRRNVKEDEFAARNVDGGGDGDNVGDG